MKFKQTDLRTTITELFVDLPTRPSTQLDDLDAPRALRPLRFRSRKWAIATNVFVDAEDSVGAAQFFLNYATVEESSRIVLEGAPGQGKSTVTQYICQVLRAHLLNKQNVIELLPKYCLHVKVRLPFRVDLRDLAKWISGIDPFQSKLSELSDDEPRSLEAFLARQVRHVSGGHDFDVSDLTILARASHLMLILDGFDEVADVELRSHLVIEITKGTSRLINSGGLSLQTIVTSRPAAFAKSVMFPKDRWRYYESSFGEATSR